MCIDRDYLSIENCIDRCVDNFEEDLKKLVENYQFDDFECFEENLVGFGHFEKDLQGFDRYFEESFVEFVGVGRFEVDLMYLGSFAEFVGFEEGFACFDEDLADSEYFGVGLVERFVGVLGLGLGHSVVVVVGCNGVLIDLGLGYYCRNCIVEESSEVHCMY